MGWLIARDGLSRVILECQCMYQSGRIPLSVMFKFTGIICLMHRYVQFSQPRGFNPGPDA